LTEYPTPIATVDVVLLTLREERLHVSLMTREKAPFPGSLALPGGFVHVDEDRSLDDAVRRVLRDKTGLSPRYLEQLMAFGGPERDPRGWSISLTYFAVAERDKLTGKAGLTIVAQDRLPPLPFDHAEIIASAITRFRRKSSYSVLPAYLLGETFTLAELQSAYEIVLGRRLVKTPFRVKILGRNAIEPVDCIQHGAGRPAQLYRIRPGRHAEFDGTI
jgi:ADP-ribose pyrophosphatase YjhB (NUDIX family)